MRKDLIILVADKDTECCLNGLLPRFPQVLGTKPFSFDIYSHPLHDAGCRGGSSEFLRPFIQDYDYCIVIFDHEGSGGENKPRTELSVQIENDLEKNGWEGRSKVIIIEPELENWIWVRSPHLAQIINWSSPEELENWLIENQYKRDSEQIKPNRPKEALEAAMKVSKKRRSSAIYEDLAERVSFRYCVDQSFIEFKQTLHRWFRIENPS